MHLDLKVNKIVSIKEGEIRVKTVQPRRDGRQFRTDTDFEWAAGNEHPVTAKALRQFGQRET